jgi:hypothetical protein
MHRVSVIKQNDLVFPQVNDNTGEPSVQLCERTRAKSLIEMYKIGCIIRVKLVAARVNPSEI